MNGKMVPLIWGVVIGGIGIWSFFGMNSWFKFLVGPVCLLLGWHSLKAAVFMSDAEINEISQRGEYSRKKTKDKFNNL